MTLLVLYQLLYPFVALVALARVAGQGRWGAFREGSGDLRERLGRPAWTPGKRTLWLHAASVGEAQALGGFLRRLAERRPAPRVIVTCSTAAGREKARTLPGVTAAFLAPADFLPCVSSFLSRVRPEVLLVAESELWPMTLALARRRGVRVGLVNACLSERSGQRWTRALSLARLALDGVERAAFQTEADRLRFLALGVPPGAAAVCGNPKHDLGEPPAEALAAARERLASLFRGAPAWVAGSTRPGEEELVLAAHRQAALQVPGLRLVLAPRHPERCGEVAALLRRENVPFARWSEPLPFSAEPQCLLVDTLGVLAALYAAAGVGFVGGTLVPGSGGHNVLEPATLGVPVLFGPHTEAVRAEAEALERAGGGRRARDAASLGEAAAGWCGDARARTAAAMAAKAAAVEFSGATDRTLRWLEPLLAGGN